MLDGDYMREERKAIGERGKPNGSTGRLRRIERTIPYLFRICAILAAFQVVVFLIAVGVI